MDRDGQHIVWVDSPGELSWDAETPILIIGCGGCGLVAALSAAEAGAQVLVVEKESRAGGNTSLSQGMIPAAGTAIQKEQGIEDSPGRMASDILAKNKHESDPALTLHVARESGPLVDWLMNNQGIKLRLVTNFLYPGHTRHRIHAPSTTKGAQLVAQLLEAVSHYSLIDIAYGAQVNRLVAQRSDAAVLGAEVEIKGVGLNRCRAENTILALNGFAANPEMVATYIPEMSGAYYFGHEGNTGEAIRWGEALGAALADMGSYQAHGSVAYPHGTLLTWAVITLGGYQVNLEGRRFVNEDHGYSEHALCVLAQPGGMAVEIFDRRICDEVEAFEDFKQCLEMGAVKEFNSLAELSKHFGMDAEQLAKSHEGVVTAARAKAPDEFGRVYSTTPLGMPLYGVKVTGALFHTQGGLVVDEKARVCKEDGGLIPGLFAGGGSARGFSGSGVEGYLSANGLLAALALGRIAGREAARAAMTR
jgi:fumarate reductase flavoprotein subunit